MFFCFLENVIMMLWKHQKFTVFKMFKFFFFFYIYKMFLNNVS